MTDHLPAWDSGLQCASISDPGLRRNSNQDSWVVQLAPNADAWQQRGHLLLVADGMGAHAAGELASKMAADLVPLCYQKLVDHAPAESLRMAFEDANEKINSRGRANAEFHGMGTTASALLLLPAGAVVAHVGDSRVYRLRDGRLEQLSFDHSLFWEMTAGGQVRNNDVPLMIPKNIITRSLGPNPQVQVDLEGPFPYETGDAFLLCSDGLSGLVQDDEIGAILAALPAQQAVQVLTDLANLRGGPDNITVVVAQVDEHFAGARVEPGEAGASGNAALHPALMILGSLAVLGLGGAAAWLAWVGRAMQAGILAVAAGLGAASLVERRLRARAPAEPADGAARFGRGPYTQCACAEPRAFAEKIELLSEQVRQAAVAEGWTIRWDEFETQRQAAHTALAAGQSTDAVRSSCLALQALMQQVRQRRTAGET